MAGGKVKGVLFVDYVRMIRARKDVDWSERLSPEAEEAAATQAEGFFVRLLELAGARSVWAGFVQASWHTDAPTVLSLEWT